jgi:hypothetical protein
MRFRYQNAGGKAINLPDVAALLQGIERGVVTPETLISIGDSGSWQRAETVAAYQQAVAGLSRSPGVRRMAAESQRPESHAQSPVPEIPWYTRRQVRIGLGAATAALVLVFGFLRVRHLDRERAAATARAVTAAAEPSLDAQHALSVITNEFGESAGRSMRRAEDRLDSRRLRARLRGTALKNSASVRTLNAAATSIQADTDSLIARSAALAETLRSRADSLETGHSRYDGLLLRVEDALEQWRRDLDHYAALQFGFAATLDSVARFLLQGQGSFVVREGQPVFLSRADATRFADLNDQLKILMTRRTAWAEGMSSRWPAWLAAIPDSSRPRFEGSIRSAP